MGDFFVLLSNFNNPVKQCLTVNTLQFILTISNNTQCKVSIQTVPTLAYSMTKLGHILYDFLNHSTKKEVIYLSVNFFV